MFDDSIKTEGIDKVQKEVGYLSFNQRLMMLLFQLPQSQKIDLNELLIENFHRELKVVELHVKRKYLVSLLQLVIVCSKTMLK